MWNRNRIAAWCILGAAGLVAAAILVWMSLSGQDEPLTAQNGVVTSYAQQAAFDDPVVALVQDDATDEDWNWTYYEDTTTCSGSQQVAEQTAADPIRVTGDANIAIGTQGRARITIPDGARVYSSLTVALGDHSHTIPYLPADLHNGWADVNFNGGLYAPAANGQIAERQSATAKLEVSGVTAADCYGTVAAKWTQPVVVAVAPAFRSVAHVTPHPPTSTPAPTPTNPSTPGPSPTPTRAPIAAYLSDADSSGNLLRPVIQRNQSRPSYVVAEMYQDVRVGNYGPEGVLRDNAWTHLDSTQSCEVSLTLADQEGLDIRAAQTPVPTWTPVPPTATPEPLTVAAVLPAVVVSGTRYPDRIVIGTPTPTPPFTPVPAPAAVPDPEPWNAPGSDDTREFHLSVSPTRLREPVSGTTDYPITVTGRIENFEFPEVYGMELFFPGDGPTPAGKVSACTDEGADYVASDQNTGGLTQTVTVTICGDNTPEWAGENIRVKAQLRIQGNNALVQGAVAYAYVQIIEPTSPGINTSPADNNATNGGGDTAPDILIQPPDPTPPYAQSTEWQGWSGRTIGIDLDGVASLVGVPDGVDVYAWGEIATGPTSAQATPLARFPVAWQDRALHLWAGSGRVVVPSHALSINTKHRELRLYLRVAPMVNCSGLRLQWQRPAAAVVSALNTNNPFAEWLGEPTPTPHPDLPTLTPTPTPTPPPTPVAPLDQHYYAMLLTGNVSSQTVSQTASDCNAFPANGFCWKSDTSQIFINLRDVEEAVTNVAVAALHKTDNPDHLSPSWIAVPDETCFSANDTAGIVDLSGVTEHYTIADVQSVVSTTPWCPDLAVAYGIYSHPLAIRIPTGAAPADYRVFWQQQSVYFPLTTDGWENIGTIDDFDYYRPNRLFQGGTFKLQQRTSPTLNTDWETSQTLGTGGGLALRIGNVYSPNDFMVENNQLYTWSIDADPITSDSNYSYYAVGSNLPSGEYGIKRTFKDAPTAEFRLVFAGPWHGESTINSIRQNANPFEMRAAFGDIQSATGHGYVVSNYAWYSHVAAAVQDKWEVK